ncbi:MAG: acyltransferase family protein, partial [Bacteroidaceae bacterium]|nr:acyltransferase family protein [Bacteroidaceae bacterium]
MVNQRIKYWDNIKGFAILLVLWGHLIQAIYGYDYAASSANLVYGIIYSFHMALFFIVSGYFSCYDGRELKEFSVLKKKSAGLLIPFFVVGGLY